MLTKEEIKKMNLFDYKENTLCTDYLIDQGFKLAHNGWYTKGNVSFKVGENYCNYKRKYGARGGTAYIGNVKQDIILKWIKKRMCE